MTLVMHHLLSDQMDSFVPFRFSIFSPSVVIAMVSRLAFRFSGLDLEGNLPWCRRQDEDRMSLTRFFKEDLRARVAAIFLISGLILPETLWAEVILEAGQIHRSTREADIFAEVVYRQEERHPAPGDGEQQAGRMEIKAAAERADYYGMIDSSGEGNIQAQTDLGHAASQLPAVLDTVSGRRGKGNDGGAGKRIVGKLLLGSFVGVLSAGNGFAFGSDIDNHSCQDDDEREVICIEGSAILGMFVGTMVGTPIGVSAMDPHDRFIYVLAGSLAGGLAGHRLAYKLATIESLYLYPGLVLIGSLSLATLGSEWSRDRPKARSSTGSKLPRLFISLVPGYTKGLLAVANLRF